MTPTSSVIVLSYRPGEWLRPCLESVVSQADEVILVDNASQGSEASTIARQVGATVLRRETNLGFAAGVNHGLKAARGEMVGLLNDDAVAGANWLSAAAQVFADDRIGAVTPKVLLSGRYVEIVAPRGAGIDPDPVSSIRVDGVEVISRTLGPGLVDVPDGGDGRRPFRGVLPGVPFYAPVPDDAPGTDEPELEMDGTPINPGPLVSLVNHAGSFLRAHGIAGEYGLAAPDDGRFDRRSERFGFSGTAPVLRRECLKQVGGLAGPFFAYNEDTDWCLRARTHGWGIVYDPSAQISHHLSATSGGATNLRVQHLAQRNALLCLFRNAPLDVIGKYAMPRLRKGPKDQVRKEVLRLLPWALATRVAMQRRRVIGPEDLWEAWAERDTTWDQSPARSGSPRESGG